jgi:hypothetical protein
MLSIWTGPDVTWATTLNGYKAILEYCLDRKVRYSMHLNETPEDNDMCRRNYGRNIVDLLDEIGFLTDLFPWSMNKDKFNVLFYKNESYRDAYFALKERKAKLVEDKLYKGDVRREIAWEFGKLLSYSDEAIERMIAENDELEEFDF